MVILAFPSAPFSCTGGGGPHPTRCLGNVRPPAPAGQHASVEMRCALTLKVPSGGGGGGGGGAGAGLSFAGGAGAAAETAAEAEEVVVALAPLPFPVPPQAGP